MDSRQRISDEEEMLRVAIDGMLSQVWTSLPGYIVSYDASSNTATIQLGVKGELVTADQRKQAVNYPLLQDVPVEFPHGGGCTLTFPIKAGDECWVSFACRAIGAWKKSGGVQPANDPRMHDLSDAVCRVGPRSQANNISGISTAHAQLRSDDGSTYVDLDPSGQVVNIVAPGGATIQAPTLHLIGCALTVDKTVTAQQNITSTSGDVVAGTISLKTHHTSGVTPGSGVGGPPVP